MRAPLPPGSTIGILGGGQLGRMMAIEAARLGLHCVIFDPADSPPAAEVSLTHVRAGFDDTAALRRFAGLVDVVTLEFENVPVQALDTIAAQREVRPGPRSLHVSQDRLTEKRFLEGLGLRVAPYAAVGSPQDLDAAIARTGLPAILKTRRLGYDGRGQARVRSRDEAEAALADLTGAPAILEGVVPFSIEISVVTARGADGAVTPFEPAENVHENGILRLSRVPATLTGGERDRAFAMARTVAEALDHVGVLAVEFFLADPWLVVNEIAPRVHNSGHWTQAGCLVCQFEQHVRAVAGWPLGDGSRHSDVEMENLLGDDVGKALTIAADPAVELHLYGKAEARPGRKMGHVNRIIGPAAHLEG